jgi:cell division protein FtsI/penicillin-binding protein 2
MAKNQQIKKYAKYVNTFIGTAPLNDPKVLVSTTLWAETS